MKGHIPDYLSTLHGEKNKPPKPFHQVNYLKLEGEGSSCKKLKIYQQFKFRNKIGIADSVLEPQPCNFEK